MSQAEMVLTILGYGVITLNVFVVCAMIEQCVKYIAECKWGKKNDE